MKLHRTHSGPVVERDGSFYHVDLHSWDSLLNAPDFQDILASASREAMPGESLAPIVGQEVWAAGVTYLRSRSARMEEAKASGGGDGDFYDKVYHADRPELFFKAVAHRVVGPDETVHIRRDSKWNVPEPELALVLNTRGEIIGYTIGNDMSSRDIEGENPLYLPQAKCYDRSCALGPSILVTAETLSTTTPIHLRIMRAGVSVFDGSTGLDQLKRDPASLAEFLFRECGFPQGAFLLTGTGIVPPDDFTLEPGDLIQITIPPIGTLSNTVTQKLS